MSTRRQQTESAAAAIAGPILNELGLDLVEVAVTGPGRAPVLRFVIDRPGGGITVGELATASRNIETALAVSEIIPGRHHLEVSSPGIDRPWKTLRDYEKHIGARAAIKTFAPLAGGQRHLRGRLAGVEGDAILLVPDGGDPVTIPFRNIASARPEVDWEALLRGGRKKNGPVAEEEENAQS